MSATTLIALIVVILVALLSYAFITQTISQKRKKKQRLVAALKSRQKDFIYLCNGFPEGFLSKELNLLVHQCLVDVTAQLSSLEPGMSSLSSELTLHSQKLEQVKRETKATTYTPLNNPTQIKEVKTLLQGLHNFISIQQQKGHLNNSQFKIYAAEIQQMTLRLSIDSYLINANQAESTGKIKLALHFYDLAAKLLAKGGRTSNSQQLSNINDKINILTVLVANSEQPSDSDTSSSDSIKTSDDEWEKFESEKNDDPWKKKNIYD